MDSISFSLTRSDVNEILSSGLGRELTDEEWTNLRPALVKLGRGYMFMRLLHSGYVFEDYMREVLTSDFTIFNWHTGFNFSEFMKGVN